MKGVFIRRISGREFKLAINTYVTSVVYHSFTYSLQKVVKHQRRQTDVGGDTSPILSPRISLKQKWYATELHTEHFLSVAEVFLFKVQTQSSSAGELIIYSMELVTVLFVSSSMELLAGHCELSARCPCPPHFLHCLAL